MAPELFNEDAFGTKQQAAILMAEATSSAQRDWEPSWRSSAVETLPASLTEADVEAMLQHVTAAMQAMTSNIYQTLKNLASGVLDAQAAYAAYFDSVAMRARAQLDASSRRVWQGSPDIEMVAMIEDVIQPSAEMRDVHIALSSGKSDEVRLPALDRLTQRVAEQWSLRSKPQLRQVLRRRAHDEHVELRTMKHRVLRTALTLVLLSWDKEQVATRFKQYWPRRADGSFVAYRGGMPRTAKDLTIHQFWRWLANEARREAERDLGIEAGLAHHRRDQDGKSIRTPHLSFEAVEALSDSEGAFEDAATSDPALLLEVKESWQEPLRLLEQRLSKQQVNVLRLLCSDYSDVEIATLLNVTPATVRVHIFQIRKKVRGILESA